MGCRQEWMGTPGLQGCLNAMDGMVEDSSRAYRDDWDDGLTWVALLHLDRITAQ